MSTRKAATYIVAALVAGLVLGSIGLASAAPVRSSSTSGAAATCAGLGIRMGASVRAAGATLADIVAKLTGTSVEDVRAQRAAGKSFAEIAGASGISADKVVSSTLDARKPLLDDAVASKKITQAQADAALARMKTRLTSRVSDPTACDGTGAGSRKGARRGAGAGSGSGVCDGSGAGAGGRMGRGQGGNCGGTCTATQ